MKRFNNHRNLILELAKALETIQPHRILIITKSEEDSFYLEQVLHLVEDYRGIKIRSIPRLHSGIKGIHPELTIVYNIASMRLSLESADTILRIILNETPRYKYIED